MSLLLQPLFLMWLAACPAEPTGAEGLPVAQGGPAGPPPGGEGAGGGPPGGTGSLSVDLSAMKPTNSQTDLVAGEHVMVTGTIRGECAGNVAIHAVTEGSQGPVTIQDAKGGVFSLALPKNTAVFLIPHCDANSDGRIDTATGEIIGARVDIPASTSAVADVALDVSVGAVLPPPPSGGQPGEKGGLPPDGAGGPPGEKGGPPGEKGGPPPEAAQPR